MFFLDAATSGFLFQKEYDFEYALILYATTISDWWYHGNPFENKQDIHEPSYWMLRVSAYMLET